MSPILDDICELLDSYNGRDKVVRLACYSFKLYGCIKQDQPWQKAGSQLSHARMILRLFDDIPMIRYTYNYGLGKQELSRISAILGVLANGIDQIFLPVEKLCWLQELGVLKFSRKTADRLDTISTFLWASSLYICLLQTIRIIQQVYWSRECLRNCPDGGGVEAKRNLDVRLALQLITAGKLCLDFTHAVSCLPRGWLWGDKIGATTVAAIATSSSIIGLGLYFAKRRLLK